MISVFLREQQRYTIEELNKLLFESAADIKNILKLLTLKGIVKIVKQTTDEVDLSELVEIEVPEDDLGRVFYVFDYVGIVVVQDVVLKCYPKYIKQTKEYVPVLKQVLRVIEKYNSKNQRLDLYSDISSIKSYNKLAVMVFLLRDYYDFGLYSEAKSIIEENGRGEIIWNKTINDTYAFLNDNEPYYVSLHTRKNITDDQDFFRRLHLAVLYHISEELSKAGLKDIFDVGDIPFAEEELEDLGDDDYLIFRLEREIDVQYNTRKKILLQTMSSYIANKVFSIDSNDSLCMFGTTKFNLVWENVCNEILGDQRYTLMGELLLPKKLDEKYCSTNSLLSIINYPCWYGIDDEINFHKVAMRTLTPDYLSIQWINKKCIFIIFDAKYYNLQLKPDKPLSGQPGIESVTKQYLYELAYLDFIKSNEIDGISNSFLFPSEESTVKYEGSVELSFLHNLGLSNISILMLPARIVFDCYLSNRKMEFETLNLKIRMIDY